MVHFYLCCLECSLYILTVCQLLLYFLLAEKKWNQIIKVTFVVKMKHTWQPCWGPWIHSICWYGDWDQHGVPAAGEIVGCSLISGAPPFMGRGRINGGTKNVLKQPHQSHLKKPEGNFCWIPHHVPVTFHPKFIFLFFQEVNQAVGMEGVGKVCSDGASSCFAVGLLRLSHVVTPGTH